MTTAFDAFTVSTIVSSLSTSAGHMGWQVTDDGQVFEVYEQAGAIYRAASSSVLDVTTRNRIGRWLCDRPHFERFGIEVLVGRGFYSAEELRRAVPPVADPFACPACSHVEGNEESVDSMGVATCQGCSGIFTTRPIYAGDSFRYVLPHFIDPASEPAPEAWRYFDLDVLGSRGPERRHGFYDPATRLVVQVG